MNPSSLAKSQELLRSLRLKESAEQLPVIVKEAEESECSYLTFLTHLLEYEKKRREEKQLEKRLKWAAFPFHKTLDEFDLKEQQSLTE